MSLRQDCHVQWLKTAGLDVHVRTERVQREPHVYPLLVTISVHLTATAAKTQILHIPARKSVHTHKHTSERRKDEVGTLTTNIRTRHTENREQPTKYASCRRVL